VRWLECAWAILLKLKVIFPKEAAIILLLKYFEQSRVTLNGVPASGKFHIKEGRSQVDLTGKDHPKM